VAVVNYENRIPVADYSAADHHARSRRANEWNLSMKEDKEPGKELSQAAPRSRAQSRRRVLLVEDHPVVRVGLAHLIDHEADLEVCGVADDHDSALKQVEALHPDLVLLDLSLKGLGGLEVLKALKSRHAHQRVLVVSMYDETVYAARALRAGASGYSMKQAGTDTLLQAIRQVLAGGIYLSETMRLKMPQWLSRPRGLPPLDPLERLSDRELEVFRLIGEGSSTGEIAQMLGLSSKTVESHRARIKAKLGLQHASELVHRAMAHVKMA
jgi:DNA-binding NarL/FixJ family response regulator